MEWLAARRARGDAIVLHGFDEAATKKRRGEFATLPAHEANLRLMARRPGARAPRVAHPAVRRAGLDGVAGNRDALPRNGFRLLAGLSGITDLVRGTTVRARVLGIGEGFLTEPWWCRTLVLSAERTARRAASCGSRWRRGTCASPVRVRRCSTPSTWR